MFKYALAHLRCFLISSRNQICLILYGLFVLKKSPFALRWSYLRVTGLHDGRITSIPDEFYEPLKTKCFGGLPLWLDLKYFRRKKPLPGRCYERSLYLFLAHDDAVLVRGNLKTLRKAFGKEGAGHGWMELNGYVYDPTSLERIEQKLYYKMEGVSHTRKITRAAYEQRLRDNNVEPVWCPIEDYYPNGRHRDDVPFLMSVVDQLANCDPDFRRDLDSYYEAIHYDHAAAQADMHAKIAALQAEKQHLKAEEITHTPEQEKFVNSLLSSATPSAPTP